MRKLLAVLTFLLPLPFFASAQDIVVPEAFAYYESIAIVFVDSVKDGCLPDPTAVKKAFELEILKSGIKIDDAGPTAQLSFTGFAAKSGDRVVGCASNYELTLEGYALITSMVWNHKEKDNYAKNLYRLVVYRDGGVIVGPKHQFQSFAKETAVDLAQTFAVAWLKARQK